jgi:hypothetical protein
MLFIRPDTVGRQFHVPQFTEQSGKKNGEYHPSVACENQIQTDQKQNQRVANKEIVGK